MMQLASIQSPPFLDLAWYILQTYVLDSIPEVPHSVTQRAAPRHDHAISRRVVTGETFVGLAHAPFLFEKQELSDEMC